MTTQEIPLKIKEQLLELSAKLPENKRQQFISGASSRLKELSHQYENTLVYAAVGWVLGEVLEHFATVPVLNVELFDGASETGGLIGGLLGFMKDRKTRAKEEEQAKKVAQIIQDELRKAVTA